jgi:hypothetical protein
MLAPRRMNEMSSKGAVYVVGDLHGQFERLAALLSEADLVDENLAWNGGNASLVFMGDFFDRGPDGIDCLELVMRLREQAHLAGGLVQALLGNHEIMMVSAYRFNRRLTNGPGGTFVDDWQYNGGQFSDLERLTPDHIAWIAHLPGMLLLQDHLLIHADAMFYQKYGATRYQVNAAFRAILEGEDAHRYEHILDDFSEREAFLDDEHGVKQALEMLRQFGGKRIVHGHTPIAKMIGRRGREVRGPLVYANGLVVNVDGGLYMGGSGFVYRLAALPDAE